MLDDLNNTQAVRRALEDHGDSMEPKDIRNWLAENGRVLNSDQVNGALQWLLKKRAVEHVSQGVWRIATEQPDPPEEKAPDKTRQVIPCYGLYWDRSLVSWGGGNKSLLGAKEGAGHRVDFAEQIGGYVLYQYPKLTYVGRATSSLFDRLKSHDHRLPHWDKFSWLGLKPVDEAGGLGSPSDHVSIEEMAIAMEGFLLTVEKPRDNKKGGDLLGDEYRQVADTRRTARQAR